MEHIKNNYKYIPGSKHPLQAGQPLNSHPSVGCTLESLKESTSINLSGIGPFPIKTDKDQKQEVGQEAQLS